MKSERVSLDDIAKSLGVSKALVSLVINGKGEEHGIAHETQEKVLAKAKELNYKPNHFARGLRIGKSFTIGLIVSDISNAFYSQMARNLEDMAEENGYTLITSSTDENIEREKKLVRMLRERQIDGLLVSSSQKDQTEWTRIYSEGFPVVLIDRTFPNASIPSVVVDNHSGAYNMANHILEQGYKKPMALAISPSHISTISQRIMGFREGFLKVGIEPIVTEIPFGSDQVYVDKLFTQLLNDGKFPDFVFTLNNYLATASINTLRRLKIRIPQDVGIASFDDMAYFEIMQPSITAVKQPVKRICEEAFKMIIDQINRKELYTNKTITLPVDLIIRESTIQKKNE